MAEKAKIFELKELVSELDRAGGYFLDFLAEKGIEAGIIRLHAGEKDTQGPHPLDELYYVIEGSGFIEIEGKSHAVKQGSTIFVPAKAKHRFHGNKDDLLILYVFGED